METNFDDSNQRAVGMQIEAAERELAEQEQRLGRQAPELVPVLEKIAQLYYCDGLYAKAELLYRRAADVLAEAGDHGSQAASVSFRLGLLYRAEGKFDDAEAVYLRGLGWSESASSPEIKRLYAERLCCLAGLYRDKNEYGQAEQLLLKATDIFNEIFGENNYFSRLCWLGLATICRNLGKTGDADEFVAKAAYKNPSTDTATHSDERAVIELGRLYYSQGRFSEVEQLLVPTLFSDEAKHWPEHPRVGQYLHERAELFRAQGQWENAEAAFRRSLEIRLKSLGPAHQEVGATAMSLAGMLLGQNRFADAEPVLKLALKTRVRAFGVEHPSVAACIETYSTLLKKTKRLPIAHKLDARARDIRSKLVWQSERAGR